MSLPPPTNLHTAVCLACEGTPVFGSRLTAPFTGHSRILHHRQLLKEKFIEIPATWCIFVKVAFNFERHFLKELFEC